MALIVKLNKPCKKLESDTIPITLCPAGKAEGYEPSIYDDIKEIYVHFHYGSDF